MSKSEKLLKQEIAQLKKQLNDKENALKKAVRKIEHYQSITDDITDVIWIIDSAAPKFTFISASIKKLLNYSPNEFLNLPLDKLFKSDSLSNFQKILNSRLLEFKTNKQKDSRTHTFTLYHKNGSEIIIETVSYFQENTQTGQIEIIGTARNISERVKTQAKLLESENYYKALFTLAGEAAIVFKNNVIIDCNKKCIQLLKGTKDQILGLRPWDISPEIQPDGVKSKLKAKYTLASTIKGITKQFEWQHKTFTNEVFDVEVNLILIDDNSSTFLATWREIGERKKAEKALIEKQKFIQSITDQSPDIIYIYDVEKAENTFMNRSIAKILGHSEQEFLSSSKAFFNKYMHPNDKQQFNDFLERIDRFENEFISEYEYRLKAKNGEWKWFRGKEKEFERINGKVAKIIGTVTDITETKAIEQIIVENEEKYRSIFNQSPIGIMNYSTTGYINEINNKTYEIFGVNPEDDISNYNIFYDPFIPKNELTKLTKGNTVQYYSEYDFDSVRKLNIFPTKKTGKIKVKITTSPLFNSNKETISYLAQVTDVTDEFKAQSLMKESEKKYRSIFDASNDGYLFIDTNNIITECNNSFGKMLEYSADYIIGRDYRGLLSNTNKLKDSYLNKSISSTQNNTHFEAEAIGKNGLLIPIEVSLYKLTIKNSTCFLAVVRDLREQRQMETEIYKAIVGSEEKERERYAKELHDGLGPLLSTSMIYLHTIENETNPDNLHEYITRTSDLLQEAVQSIREISNNLSPDILKRYGIIQAIHSFVEKLNLVSKTKFTIKSNLKNRLNETIEFTIYRALIELINNSMKHANANEISIITSFGDGLLSVLYNDNGLGFNYKDIKEKNKGFGLSNIENRILKLGGQYKYYTEPGKGTRVSILILTNTI